MSEAYLHGFDFSGGVWNRVGVQTSGGTKLQVSLAGDTSGISQLKPITYLTNSVVDVRSGMFMFAVLNQSGTPYLTMNSVKMSWVNPFITNMSGINPPRFDFMRITNVSGGGSGITHVRADTDDSQSGIALSLTHTVLSGCGATDVLGRWQLPTTISGAGWGIEQVMSANVNAGNTNLLVAERETKYPIARSGFGFAIRQTTDAGYTQITSGQLIIRTQYTIH